MGVINQLRRMIKQWLWGSLILLNLVTATLHFTGGYGLKLNTQKHLKNHPKRDGLALESLEMTNISRSPWSCDTCFGLNV